MLAAFTQPVAGKHPPPAILVGKVLFGGKSELTEKMTAYEVYRRFYVGIILRVPKTNHWLLPEGQQPYPYWLASRCLMPSPWQPAALIHYWVNVSIWFGLICLLRQAQVQLSYWWTRLACLTCASNFPELR